MTGSPAVLVHLVGPLRVSRGGSELAPAEIGSRKGRALLRLLSARRGSVVSAAEIAAVLWPEDAPGDPDAVVASLVSRLRRVLGADAVVGGRNGYRIGAVDTDLERARRLLDDAERADPGPAVAGAQAAERLLDGGPAEPDDDDEAAPLRGQLTALRRRARDVLARAALDSGDPVVAADAARRALDADPLDERAVRLLMRALLAQHLPADALRVYERLRRALADELGTDAAPETQELYATALRGGQPVPGPRRAGGRSGPGTGGGDRLGLAGRDEEFGVLRAAWADACRHSAGLVVLSGEPGIGKSRLLDELAGEARRTAGLVLVGRSFEGERSLFAQPVMDALAGAARELPADRVRRAVEGAGILGRLVPELAVFADVPPTVPVSSAVERSQNFAAVARFLRTLAADSPVLLVVDDLQRAGRSTLELLHYLARHLEREQLLIATAVRSGEGAEVLELLGAVATTVAVGPLSADAVAQLAGRAGHQSRALEVMRRTAGLPLFVVEVLRALSHGDSGLPPSLQTAVIERVARTGAETERLMRAASVLGSAFDPGTAAALAGVPAADALDRFEHALAAGLLVETGTQYEFAHDVVREVLLSTTPSPTRLAWHARAADLLSADPEAVATHAAAVGDRPRAARAWLNAAERALARFVASDAILLATRAVALAVELGDDEVQGRALVVRGRAYDATAAFAAAFADFRAAQQAARRAGDRRLQMTVLRELAGDVPVALGLPPADCEPVLDEGLALAGSLGDRGMEADFLDRLTVLRSSQLDFTDAAALAGRAVAVGRAADEPRVLAYGLDAVKTAGAYLGDVAALEPVVAELEPLLRRLGDLWMLQWTVFESAFVPLAAGDDGLALERIERAMEICRRSGYVAHEPFFVAHLGWVHRLAGRLDDARHAGRRAVKLAAPHRHTWWSTAAASLYAGTLLATGEAGAAADVLRPAALVADVPGAQAYLLRCLGPLAEATGDPAVLDRADALLRGIRAPEGRAWLLGADAYLGVARAWRAAGEPERADAVLAGFRSAALASGWRALAEAAG